MGDSLFIHCQREWAIWRESAEVIVADCLIGKVGRECKLSIANIIARSSV